MAASRNEKYSPQEINTDRSATQSERNEARNTGKGVSFLRSRLKKATDRAKE